MLVPRVAQLDVLAVDPRVAVVLVLEGDLHARRRRARRPGPEGERVQPLVVGDEEGGQRQHAEEGLVKGARDGHLEAVHAGVRGARA